MRRKWDAITLIQGDFAEIVGRVTARDWFSLNPDERDERATELRHRLTAFYANVENVSRALKSSWLPKRAMRRPKTRGDRGDGR